MGAPRTERSDCGMRAERVRGERVFDGRSAYEAMTSGARGPGPCAGPTSDERPAGRCVIRESSWPRGRSTCATLCSACCRPPPPPDAPPAGPTKSPRQRRRPRSGLQRPSPLRRPPAATLVFIRALTQRMRNETRLPSLQYSLTVICQ